MSASAEPPSRLPAAWPRTLLPRPRLTERIATALSESPVVAMIAGPGWGKTTVLRMLTQDHGTDVQWTDARALLDAGTAPGACSGQSLVVVDGLEAVTDADAFLGALGSLTAARDGAPGVVLAGRDCETVRAIAAELGAVVLDESDLRLSALEASQLAQNMGDEYWRDGREILRLTGGWIAGAAEIAFGWSDDWPGQARSTTYFAEHVFADLPAADQAALASFSIIDRVSLGDAIALVGDTAADLWHSLRARRLPLTSVTETELILRPSLQAFLQQWLGERHPGLPDELRVRYLDYLSSTGRFGDAISWCMRLEDSRRAIELMESAAGLGNVEPPSWEMFRAWLAVVGERALLSNDHVASSLIQRLHRDDRGEEASSVARLLRDEGRSEAIIATADPVGRSILMLSLMRPTDDLMQFSKSTRGIAGIEAAGFMLAVMGGDVEVAPPRPNAWEDMATVVRWGLFWQGRLGELLGELPGRDSGPAGDICTVLAAVWAGETARARALWESMDPSFRHRPLESVAGAALHLVEGDLPRARQVMDEACEVARIGTAAFEHAVLGATIDLLEGHSEAVVRDLPERLREMRSYRRLAIAEWGDLILALSHVRLGNRAAALEVLNSCIARMERAGRRLFLSSALMVQLHLANGRADLAEAARIRERLKASALERRAVAWERLVARICQDHALMSWADALDEPIGATVRPAGSMTVARINPFASPPRLDLDGQSLELRRGKFAEIVALLALAGGSMDRAVLIYKLFPETDLRRASNYLRQIIFQFREATGITLSRPSLGVVAWPSGRVLHSADVEFETDARRFLAQKTVNLAGGTWEQFKADLDQASAPYLEKSDLDWVAARRQELAVLYEEAVLVVIRSAFADGDIETVRHFGQSAIRLNPYSEDVYQTVMDAELRFGSGTRGRALYREIFTNLRELDLEPSAALRGIAQRLGITESVPRPSPEPTARDRGSATVT